MIGLYKMSEIAKESRTELKLLKRNKTDLLSEIEELTQDRDRAIDARSIIQHATALAQQQIARHVSNIVSIALSTVFDEPMQLSIVFAIRRNTTECDLLLEEDGEKYEIMLNAGGGVIDISSFALRVSYWSMKKTRALIILDEPFRFLSENLQEHAHDMLKTISTKLGLQIIMVSHISGLIDRSDKIYKVTRKNKISRVIEATS